MSLPLFVAIPGDQVTICLKKRNYSGQVKHVTASDTTGNGHKTRYIVTVLGVDLELDETQIQNQI